MTKDQPPPPPPGPETRISTVIGDRLCIKCSFNLSGQPVVRESTYGMAIVRCPECSTIASLQEYPLLGRWAGRFAAALAAIWLLMLIGGMFGTAGILFGMSQGSLENGSTRLAEHIAKKHAAWFEKATDAERAGIARMYGGATPQLSPSAFTWVDNTWWKKQDPAAMIAELGGRWRAIDPKMVEILFWTAFIALILGAVWSVFLLHARRWRLLIFAVLPVAIALAFAYIANSSPSMSMAWGPGGSVYAMAEAKTLLWPSIISVHLVVSYIALCIGAWIGRPLVRWLARLLLPPRMLGSLAYLWIAEGKRPPRPRVS